MTILVIGGTRFFGIPMVWSLIKKGYEVTLATRGLTNDPFGDMVSRIKLDIYNSESVGNALYQKQYDVIIDKMGYGSTDIQNILGNVKCNYFIHMSTAGVYQLDHMNISEDEYLPEYQKLIWCTRGELGYDEEKKMAEAAIVQNYSGVKYAIVRSPFVMGKNDYTNRLRFYVEHIMKEEPFYIDNINAKMSVAYADEVADFIVFLVEHNINGIFNCCSTGYFCLKNIVQMIEQIVGKKAIFQLGGDVAPYNGTQEYSLNLEKSIQLGFHFRNVDDWIEQLIVDIINISR